MRRILLNAATRLGASCRLLNLLWFALHTWKEHYIKGRIVEVARGDGRYISNAANRDIEIAVESIDISITYAIR